MRKLFLAISLFLIVGYGLKAQVEPLIENNWQTFMWPYNAYYPESQNGPNGHLGNACGYTSIARILHYWQYPNNGNGVLDFDDFFGHHWYVDLENLNLDYSDMPYELDWNDPESVYHETANLFLACGALGEDIQIGFTDGIFRIPEVMQEYMNYSAEMEVLQRWDYTREEWINIFKNELDNGRPILIDGRTPESPAPWEPGSWEGHFFVCDGYNEADLFYTNYMYGGISGYYDIDTMDNFSAYHRIIINFEPFNVGLDEGNSKRFPEYEIYPNPVREQLNINVKNSFITPTRIQLVNSDGGIIRNVADRAFHGQQLFKVNMTGLSSGIYFIRITSLNQTVVEKFLHME
jgi:hypothetical protein